MDFSLLGKRVLYPSTETSRNWEKIAREKRIVLTIEIVQCALDNSKIYTNHLMRQSVMDTQVWKLTHHDQSNSTAIQSVTDCMPPSQHGVYTEISANSLSWKCVPFQDKVA